MSQSLSMEKTLMYTVRDYDADDYEGLTNLMKNGNVPLGWDVELPGIRTEEDGQLVEDYIKFDLGDYIPEDEEEERLRSALKCLEHICFEDPDQAQKIPMCDSCQPAHLENEINKEEAVFYTRRA